MEREGTDISYESREGGSANACAKTFDESSVLLEGGVEGLVDREYI